MLKKKLFRTMLQYKAQFLSMIIMVALSVGIFLGFNIEWYSIQENTERFYEETGLANYKIMQEEGFSEENLDDILAIDGVDDAARVLSFTADVDEESGDTLSIVINENTDVTGMKLIEGEEYDDTDKEGIWLSKNYAEENNFKIGDTLTLSYQSMDIETEVKGIIQSSDFTVCVRDESQLMPDPTTHGYAYITPALFEEKTGYSYFTEIHILSSLSKSSISEKINQALDSTTLLLTRDENPSYAGPQGEIEEGMTMANVLPIVFLLIGILTMITTMHRVTMNERIQIGTLKALGFTEGKIARHYTSYALMIGIFGSVIGILLGYGVAYAIINPTGMMSTYLEMPYWDLKMPLFSVYAIILIIVLLTFIGWLSVRKLLRGNAADILRNEVTTKQRSLLIERTKWFHKRSFGTRWNLRDIMRHKSRSLMTMIGVMGCAIIIVAAFGMSDTMDEYLDHYFNRSAIYTSRIYLSDTATDEEIDALIDQYDADAMMAISIQIDNDKASTLEIYDMKSELVAFTDEDDQVLNLDEHEALVCQRIAREYDLKVGDHIEVSPYGTDDVYDLKISAITRSVSESIVISRDYAEELGITFVPSSLFTDIEKDDIASSDTIQTVQSKQMVIDSFNSFMEVMNTSIFMLIAFGCILGIVVLYNLGVMSYMERYREMATLKVLGFKDRKIGQLLISQNLWISIFGNIIGIPLGVVVLSFLLTKLAPEYELKITISLTSYLICLAITLGVSLIVSLLVARKNKKIDMVSALKNAE